MEMILISSKKLKVMLSQSDLEKRQICADIDCSNKKTRKVIRGILEEIREKTGFDTTGEGTYIQFFASKDGSCEIFITKENIPNFHSNCSNKENDGSSESNDEIQDNDSPITETTEPADSYSKGKSFFPVPSYKLFDEESHKKMAFSFEKMSHLISVCRRLKDSNYSSSSSAYYDENGNYYLIIDSDLLSKYTRLDSLTFILEYGERQNPESLLTYIDEHGKTICENNAVQILSNM